MINQDIKQASNEFDNFPSIEEFRVANQRPWKAAEEVNDQSMESDEERHQERMERPKRNIRKPTKYKDMFLYRVFE